MSKRHLSFRFAITAVITVCFALSVCLGIATMQQDDKSKVAKPAAETKSKGQVDKPQESRRAWEPKSPLEQQQFYAQPEDAVVAPREWNPAPFVSDAMFLVSHERTNLVAITCNGAGGNWNSAGSWIGGIPTAADSVTIQSGCTISIDTAAATALSVTVQSGGILQFDDVAGTNLTVAQSVTIDGGGTFQSNPTGTLTGHTLSLGGNLTNNGTLDFSTNGNLGGAGITFTGAASNTFGGGGATTDVRTITINKGTSNVNVLDLSPTNFTVQGTTTDGTPMAFLTLTNGTFKISGTFTVAGRVFTAAAYSIPATGGIWLNNPNFTVSGQNGSPTNNGLFRLSNGIYNVGTSSGNSMATGTGAMFFVEGTGIMNVTGRLNGTSTYVQYTQSGGTVNVSTIGNASSSNPSFGFTGATGVVMNISGGTINLVQASTAATPIDYNQTGTMFFTGGTLNIGTAATLTNFVFRVQGQLPNTFIDNTTNNKTANLSGQCNVWGNLTINTGTTMNLNPGTAQVLLFIGPALTNNGAIIVNTNNTAQVAFAATLQTVGAPYAQTYGGAGTFGTAAIRVASFSVQSNLGVSVSGASPALNIYRINAFYGPITGSANLAIGAGDANVLVIQRGVASPFVAGSLDVSPTFNIGSGGLAEVYSQSSTSITTGPEIPATRSVLSMQILNPTGVVLSGGALTGTGTVAGLNGLLLSSGVFTTSGANLLTLSGTAVTAIQGGTAASYVNGPLVRTLPASLVTGSTYTFPVGKGSFKMLELVNPTTNAGGTVVIQSEVFDANSGGSAGAGFSSINTNRYWSSSITAGAGNFTNSTIRLTEQGTIAVNAIGQSATQGGAYASIGGAVAAPVIGPSTTAVTSLGFFVVGTLTGAPTISGTFTVGTGGSYTSLTLAVADLNAKLMTGAVTFSLTDNVYPSETFPITIQPNGGASATNTLTIKPATGATPSFTGSAATALIILNGADYVTIDGSNTVGGTTRNMTLANTNTGTTSAVLWGQTVTTSDPATNNTFKNLNLTGNASTTTLVGVGFGSSVIGTASLGTRNDGNRIQNNNVITAQIGIYSQGGSSTNKNLGTVITGNLVGGSGTSAMGREGIFVGFEDGVQITNNTVAGVGGFANSVDAIGIALGSIAIANTSFGTINDVANATVTGNVVGPVTKTDTFSASGISMATNLYGTSLIANNSVFGVIANGTSGDFCVGIYVGASTAAASQKVYFNSVSITGNRDTGGSTSQSAYALAVLGANPAIDIRNNSLYNTSTAASGGVGGAAGSYAIGLSSTVPYTNLTSNYNDLFTSGTSSHFSAIGNLINIAGDQATLAAWQAATGKDANSISVDPLYNSTTDLRPQLGSPLVGAGISGTGVLTDLLGVVRSVSTPTIGAYENAVDVAGPVITYSALGNTTSTSNRTQSMTVTDASGVPTAGIGLPVIYFKKNAGAYSPNQCTSTGGSGYDCVINYASVGGVVVGDQISYYVAAQDSAGVPNVSVNPSAGASGFSANPPAASTPPTSPNTYIISTAVSGTLSVGTGAFTSLTNNNPTTGIFRFLNDNVVTGNITIEVTGDLLIEDGAVALNEFPAPFTVTIKPTGGTRNISGTAAAGLITLNAADRVTIDGSTSGGTDRSLTITNTNTGTSSAVVWLRSSGANGATNNTVKNVNVVGTSVTATPGTLIGVGSGSSTVSIGSFGTGNNSNTYQNNDIRKTVYGIYSGGLSAAGKNTGTVISQNVMNAASPNNVTTGGIFVNFEDGVQITRNDIGNLLKHDGTVGTTATVFGIALGLVPSNTVTIFTGNDVINAVVTRNRIDALTQLNSTGYSSFGIVINSVTSGTTLVANNMISQVRSASTASDFSAGIVAGGGTGSTTQIANNSVSMTGTRGAATFPSYGLAINSGNPIMDVRNNIFVNLQTSTSTGKMYAIANASTTFTNMTSNHNDLFVTGASGFIGQTGGLGTAGTDRATLADWQTATGQDTTLVPESISADPMYTSASDLHVVDGSPVINAGARIAYVPEDFDGDPRPGGQADEIGADEKLDAIAPDTTMGTTPTDPSNSSSATFTFSGSDSRPGQSPNVVASFECKLDAAAFATCTSPVNLIGLSDGSHTFQVRAKDFAGNVDPSPASFTWTIDTTAPDTSITSNPTNPTNSTTGTFNFTGNDGSGVGGLTFQCKLDAGAFTACTSPQSYPGLADGSHTFQVRASDSLGNQDATPASFTWVVDTIAPDTQILTNPPDPSGSTSATFTFNGSDSVIAVVASFECKLDAGAFAPCTSPQTYLGLSAGSHTFQVRAIDAAGNTDASPASYTWMITLGGGGPVTVTATAGTTGPTDYATLKLAIDAINAGTHQGAVTVSVVSNTTEVATSVLNSSGAGAAVYTSVLIRPTNDGVTVAGPSVLGSGLIELNGADNVTIDGDNPNTAGTNRNLTIQNTAVNTTNFTSVIRIALAATIVTSADNCTIKNLILLGSATGRNIAAASSTTGPENTTYGIVATGGASTVSATTAPTPLASTTLTIGTGATATNLTIQNNSITTVARAVAVQGSAATVFPGLLIENNSIGNATAGNVDQVYSMGVTAQGTNNAIMRGNTVYVESFGGTGIRGIEFGSISATGTTALIEKNKVLRVRNNNAGTFGAYGINLGGGSTHTVQNNFVADVRNDQTSGTGAFSTTFGAFGIRVASGTGHKVLHNSVHMFGLLPGTVSTDLTAAMSIVATGQQNMDVRNNIFSNQLTGGNPTGTRHVSINLPTGATVAMNLTENNNAYYQGTDANSRMAQVGVAFGTGEYQAANFDPTTTAPATNFRAYTSPLSAAGTNDNASFATTTAPPFTSNTDLHIPSGTVGPLESGGASGTGVTDDIDAQARNATPDIGADEFAGVPPPANDIAATALVLPANGAVILTGAVISPQASFKNVGTAVQTNVNVQFTMTGPGGYNYSNAQVIPTINPNQTITVTFAAAPAFTTQGAYVSGAAVTTSDSNAGNDTISGGFTVASPLNGTYTVGSGGNFPSLTNPGGIFESINSLGATGNIIINITSDLTGESGSVPLNQVAGGFTVTIKPSGAARSITSTATAVAVIKLNEADNVTIDGSLSAGTDRSLSIINSNPGASTAGIWVAGTANGAQNNTLKNLNIEGGTNQSVTNVFNFGIIASSSGAILTGGTDLDNNTYRNNFIKKVSVGIISIGGLASNMNQGTQMVGNVIGPAAFGVDEVATLGILIFNENLPSITGNELRFIGDTALTGGSSSRDHVGISLCTGNASWSGGTAPTVVGTVTNANISGNRIHDIVDRSTFSAVGIVENCTNAGNPTTNTIANNFIYNILANGTTPDQAVGIALSNGNGDTVAFNSIYMTGDIDPATTTSANVSSFGISAAFTPVINLNLRDNTSTMDLSSNTGTLLHSAINIATGFAWGTGGSNFNNWHAPAANPQSRVGTVGGSGGTFHATLLAWQTATSQDGGSFSTDPLFVSGTDLHLQSGSPLINVGTTIVGITTDIDGDTRPTGAAPEIGADEFVPAGGGGTLQFSSLTYTIGEAGVQASITVTRTGGTGSVSVDYATVAGGSATGGGACGGTVDYVNTSGTLIFPDTNPQSFNIPICSDALDEANETVNLALSNATGGATIGTQSTAVLTITDDDATPSLAIASPSPQAAPETNSGSHQVTFNVNLSAASGQTVTVHYQTNDGSATTANNDYVGILDTILTFNPGETSLPINVTVNGDITPEPDESFTVSLSTPSNATIGTNSASATILNDDGSLSTFSINDVRTKEANGGMHTVTFTVSMFSPGAPPGFASVQYATGGGTATPGVANPADYMSTSGTKTFGAADAKTTPEGGSTQTQTFTVTIFGDVNKEPNETFFVTLSNPVNGVVGDGSGVCIIFDEDRAYVGDFDRDLKTDLSVFRPVGDFVDGVWYTSQSTNGVTKYEKFGNNGDKIVPGDYDADGVTDLAVFRPSTGTWVIQRSSDFVIVQRQWGVSTDLPVQGDYDGDDRTDIAVFRPSNGTWYILYEASSQEFQWGASGDKVVPGDYDGDGKNDFAVFRPSSGTWFVQPNTDVSATTTPWGTSGDVPVSGDFDGDGKTDVAVFRPSDGNWYILTSLNGTVIAVHWGQAVGNPIDSDIPVVGDYDADGISDIAVWRPSNGNWYILNSNDPAPALAPDAVIPAIVHWGQNGDKPVPAGYVPEQ